MSCWHVQQQTTHIYFILPAIFYLFILKIITFLLRENDAEKQHEFGRGSGIGFSFSASRSAAPVRSLRRGRLKDMEPNCHCFLVLQMRHIFSALVISDLCFVEMMLFLNHSAYRKLTCATAGCF